MYKIITFSTALAMSAALGVTTFNLPAFAQKNSTQEARASREQKARNPGENSYTCKGEAKQDSVTKGALYGGGGGLLLGGPVGAIVGVAAGAGAQHMQNNAACGR
ncbi:MAG: hypothetical protein H7Y22_04175 [Gemmatimonadaceae bacterium]|nr:hypothetical protein [Gloeobacterales cyanobacterium ES-bin-141]